jgi:hypothetical protein
MSSTITVSSVLTTEIPSLHSTLITLTLGHRFNVNILADLEMSWPQAVSDRDKHVWSDFELSKVLLRRQVVLQQVTYLSLVHMLEVWLTSAHLDSVSAIFFLRKDLSYLAPVHLDDGAWNLLAPLVVVVSAPHFVSDQASSLAVSRHGFVFFQLILRVDLVLERFVCVYLTSEAELGVVE